ncbi:MAG: WD40/YVTN/BNR-like repeat-containing protein [Bryobacteraceae bacterium]
MTAEASQVGRRLTICVVMVSSLALGQWIPVESSATDSGLRGVHNAGNGVIWASGTNGTVLRSEDDGFVWQICRVPSEARTLDFRGIWAWDANHAIVMSSGTGDASKLYETRDGGATWRLLFQNSDPTGFWDGVAFTGNNGLLVGDPVDGNFTVFRSEDMGQHWTRDSGPQLAADPKRDGIFAASNSSLTVGAFVTGGLNGPKLFTALTAAISRIGRPGGVMVAWSSTVLPLATNSESSGAFSFAFNSDGQGVAVGGDYKKPGERMGTAAYRVYGTHWEAASIPPSGFRSALAWDPNLRCWIAVGPNGSDVSSDGGKNWRPFDKGNWNALSLPWVVGPKGRIARLDERAVKALFEKK